MYACGGETEPFVQTGDESRGQQKEEASPEPAASETETGPMPTERPRARPLTAQSSPMATAPAPATSEPLPTEPPVEEPAPLAGLPACAGADCDCADFASHAEAQAFYESQGPGDPHRLDRDADGLACETLP